ncbi:MAG: LTA synthase family protein, partial [Bacteroidaceae bacterium]|nr:LTA synthase family protein [Bacteroidaceae bacterium]
KELGGLPDVAPGWSRFIPEGIFWENYYSNSFRTDRGTVCAFSGWLSFTDVGLMKKTELHPFLPSLARSLDKAGYETGYIYGGSMSNIGKGVYLENMDFQHLYSEKDFPAEQKGSGWGVPDSIVLQRACQIVGQWKGGHHFLTAQTLSSHEPWDVPYHRFEDDKILNSFAYTDYSLACMMDSLKQLPQWDNLLVIMIPDHGFLYKQTYNQIFFRAPMLWTGGAIRGPRKMDVLMNQSDLPATLLSQLGIPHDEYPWSRNVLSQTYTYPFVYSNWPAGLLFADSTGISIYDVAGDVVLEENPADDGLRVKRAQAILQTSYDQLGKMRKAAKEALKNDAPR